jgi:hypothetical protein
MKQGSEIAPRSRGGRGVKEFLMKKFSELCELCASVVNTFSQETRNNQNAKCVPPFAHFALRQYQGPRPSTLNSSPPHTQPMTPNLCPAQGLLSLLID